MIKTILVIGSVTADDYTNVRLELLRDGHKPKIVRVKFRDFFLDEADLIERYADPEQKAQINDFSLSYEDYTSFVDYFVSLHMGNIGDVHTVVMDEYAWRFGSEVNDDIATALNQLGAVRWIVRRPGQVEYAG